MFLICSAMPASGSTSLIGSFFRQSPDERNLSPVPFTAGHERLRQIAALWPDGRCLIARGYEDDRELASEIERLQQRHRIPEVLSRRSGTLEDVAAAWSGGAVPLPSAVSGLRCQRGPHDPDSDHMYCRLFYRERLDGGMTLEDLGFSSDEADIFTRIRMARHGAIFLGGSTGDGKSTTLAVNLALQLAEHISRRNLNVGSKRSGVGIKVASGFPRSRSLSRG